MGFSHSYVWRLDFLRLGVNYFYVLGLVFFTFEGESLLRLGVCHSYNWGLVLLRLGVSFLTFGGEISYVWG